MMKNELDKAGERLGFNRLDGLKVGSKAMVAEIVANNKLLSRRMFEMGLTKGVEICVKKIAPLGDPVSIELRGYELCLRKDELKNIKVKII